MTDPPPTAEVSIEQFAKETLTELYNMIIAQEPGALDGDVTAIHDMRVATRRLRVALSNFAIVLSREDRRRLQSYLKNLAEELGGVRDFDVIIEALRSKLRTKPREEAIKSIIGRFQARRRRQHQQLLSYLQEEDFADFKREYSSLWTAVAKETKSHGQAA
jgi:CHAD domain-containing protein